MTVAERVRCRCGLAMQLTAGGAQYCENCDGVQAQQVLGRPRLKTREDVRFEMYWVKEESKYEDNTKPNNEDEGDTDG